MACRESAARLALLYLVSLYTNRRSRIAVHGPICNRCKLGKRGKRKMEGNEIECKKTDSNSQLIETSLRAISTAYIYTSPRSRRRTLKRYGVTRCLSRPFVFFLRLLKTAKRAKKKKKKYCAHETNVFVAKRRRDNFILLPPPLAKTCGFVPPYCGFRVTFRTRYVRRV